MDRSFWDKSSGDESDGQSGYSRGLCHQSYQRGENNSGVRLGMGVDGILVTTMSQRRATKAECWVRFPTPVPCATHVRINKVILPDQKNWSVYKPPFRGAPCPFYFSLKTQRKFTAQLIPPVPPSYPSPITPGEGRSTPKGEGGGESLSFVKAPLLCQGPPPSTLSTIICKESLPLPLPSNTYSASNGVWG